MMGAAMSVAGNDTDPGPTIEHDPVDCVVAGQYPLFPACIHPAGESARGRVYFQTDGDPAWYYVVMKAQGPCWAGVLPKPSRALVDRHINYYLEATGRSLATSRTAEHAALVVKSKEDCQKPVVAALASTGPAAVLPLLPAGFSVGAVPAVLVVAGAGAATLGAVAVVAPPSNPPPTTGPPTQPIPGPVSPVPTPTPPVPTTPPPAPAPAPTPASNFRLEVKKTPVGHILGSVTSAPPGIACGSQCATASGEFSSGKVVTLTAQGILGSFRAWTGDCSGSGTCVVVMDDDKKVTAHFSHSFLSTPTGEPGALASMRSQLTVPGGRGEVVVNGRPVAVSGGVQTEVALPDGEEDLVVEAWLREGGGGGLWRFDLRHPAGDRPRTPSVLAGEPVHVGPGAIVFRLRGKRPERVAFALRRIPDGEAAPADR